MGAEVVTKDDLQELRIQLLDDMKRMFATVQKTGDAPEWMRSIEVRRLLKVSPGTLQNLRIAGKLHPKKIGGSWYYSRSEINGLFGKD